LDKKILENYSRHTHIIDHQNITKYLEEIHGAEQKAPTGNVYSLVWGITPKFYL
jgi:hypothetical protein